MQKIHPSAIVESGAQLGQDVEIGPFCHIGPQVVLGDRSICRSHVVIDGKTIIGDDNQFFPFTVIGFDPQDLKYKKEETLLTIGHSNIFREGVSVHRGTVSGKGETSIGDHNLFMGYVHIAHDCIIGHHNILANYTGLSGHVEIDNYVTLGGQNGVIQFVHIGSYGYFGAGTMIDKNIAPYTTGYGNRIIIKGVNIVGLKRRGYPRETINAILEVHRIFFRTDLNEEEALHQIEQKFGDLPEIRMFIDFIRSCDGGVKR